MSLIVFTASAASAADGPKAEPNFFANLNIGAFKNFTSFYSDFVFDYGGKLGVRVTRLEGFSQLYAALAINRNSSSEGGLDISNLELMVQPLFMNVSDTGFYFAPQLGLNFIGLGVNTTAEFAYGALVGWAFPVTDTLSIAPEVNLTRFSDFGTSQTALKALVGANLAF
jgi:hypothetical protein